jgi:hypothetical protein
MKIFSYFFYRLLLRLYILRYITNYFLHILRDLRVRRKANPAIAAILCGLIIFSIFLSVYLSALCDYFYYRLFICEKSVQSVVAYFFHILRRSPLDNIQ